MEQEPQQEDDVAPEVPTSFATKGVGWSGRETDDFKGGRPEREEEVVPSPQSAVARNPDVPRYGRVPEATS